MADLCLYLGITLVGYVIGYISRAYRSRLHWVGTAQTVFLFTLVLMMGMKMGANEEVTAHLGSIGLTALVITVFTIAFSVLGIYLTRKLMKIDKFGHLKGSAPAEPSQPAHENATSESASSNTSVGGMTVLIVLAVVGGMAVGYLVIRRIFAGNMPAFDEYISLGIKLGLCSLLIFVGIDLGLDPAVVENFKKVGIRVLAFPAAAIVFTLLGAGISGMLMGLSIRESLAIGAGFGWYSLAPGIIMDAGYVTASAISFLHNVLRELLSILFIPVVAQKIGYVETTGMPGAAAMDVCLPLVEKSTSSEITVYSFVSGVILSALVPVLVPLLLGI